MNSMASTSLSKRCFLLSPVRDFYIEVTLKSFCYAVSVFTHLPLPFCVASGLTVPISFEIHYHEYKIPIITSNTFNFVFISVTSRCSAIQGDMYSCQKSQGIC